MRTEPDDPQQLPCPQQRIEFLCQILVPSSFITWTLPASDLLEFAGVSDIGYTVNSSDNVYSATLTNKGDDPNSNTRFFFTSTLLVLEPVNGSTLTCTGGSGADPMVESTTINISGM